MTLTSARDGAPQPGGERAAPRVSDLLTRARVRIPLRSADKEGVVAELVDLVVAAEGLATEREALYSAVWEREKVLSTGIGEGVALPHARHTGVPALVMAAGVSR